MMNQIKNDRLLKALRKETVDQTPVWIMRQAGRYLPEYLKVREQAGSFMALCKTPELACEVTMQPIRRYGFDAAILFSDILTIPDAMGLGLEFEESLGPVFHRPIKTAEDIKNLPIPDPHAELNYVVEAVKLIKSELQQSIPLIGFSGSPFTLATYMVEGKPTKNFHKIKQWLYGAPDDLHRLLHTLSESIELYLMAQINAGTDLVMIFDTWGGLLTTEAYQAFSLAYMQKIVAGIKQKAPQIPIIVFTKGGALWLEEIADIGCDCVGLDWTVNIGDARERIGSRVALQGNLDPAILAAPDAVIIKETQRILDDFGLNNGHIFNLGHGITPEINPDKVNVLLECIRSYSPHRR